VEPTLLTVEEMRWLDDYHARVAATLAPLVDADTRAWLAVATRPLEN
jgi:Xaa-Pro aminopeptidase